MVTTAASIYFALLTLYSFAAIIFKPSSIFSSTPYAFASLFAISGCVSHGYYAYLVKEATTHRGYQPLIS